MKTTIVLLVVVLTLTGCAGEFYPISDDTIQKTGEYTKDASVAKEEAVHKTLRNRDNKYAVAYATSGMKVKFKMVEVSPGVHVQVIEELAMKESPRFDTPLPQASSIHPMWATITSVGNNIVDKTFLGFLGNKMFGTLDKSIENAGTHYNGPYNQQNYAESFNATAEPFVVTVPAP